MPKKSSNCNLTCTRLWNKIVAASCGQSSHTFCLQRIISMFYVTSSAWRDNDQVNWPTCHSAFCLLCGGSSMLNTVYTFVRQPRLTSHWPQLIVQCLFNGPCSVFVKNCYIIRIATPRDSLFWSLFSFR